MEFCLIDVIKLSVFKRGLTLKQAQEQEDDFSIIGYVENDVAKIYKGQNTRNIELPF